MAFKDHFSTQAREYTRFRPRYPRELFAFLAGLAPTRQRAWDCGTGNGQAALPLAEFFDEVVATDPSQRQIVHAIEHPNVRYLVSAAEHVPLANDSVDLVTVAQALHWFDFDRFYAEVRRVGHAGSVLAAWSYGLAKITPEVDAAVWYLYHDILETYWPPERAVIMQGYRTLPFPFPEISAPEYPMTARWSLGDLLGYLGTWSSTRAYRKQHGTDPIELARDALTAAWGRPDLEREVRWPLYVRVGRIG